VFILKKLFFNREGIQIIRSKKEKRKGAKSKRQKNRKIEKKKRKNRKQNPKTKKNEKRKSRKKNEKSKLYFLIFDFLVGRVYFEETVL
jgi:hypothetical protein